MLHQAALRPCEFFFNQEEVLIIGTNLGLGIGVFGWRLYL
jgi:hypothetical protein